MELYGCKLRCVDAAAGQWHYGFLLDMVFMTIPTERRLDSVCYLPTRISRDNLFQLVSTNWTVWLCNTVGRCHVHEHVWFFLWRSYGSSSLLSPQENFSSLVEEAQQSTLVYSKWDDCKTALKKLAATLQMYLFLLTGDREVLLHAVLDLKTSLDWDSTDGITHDS